MRRWLTLMMVMLCVGYSKAQTVDILVEACNAITDGARRLECLKAAISKAPAKLQAGYEPVVRAFTGLKGSLDVGLTYVNYQAAVQEIARELAVFERDAAPESQAGISKLKEALDTYSDAGKFWQADISFYADSSNRIAYGGGLPMGMTGLAWMIHKHDLPTRKSDIWGFETGVPPDLGRSVMWRKASQLAEEGFALLKNPTPPNGGNRSPSVAQAGSKPPEAQGQIFIWGITAAPSDAGGLEIVDLIGPLAEKLKVGDLITQAAGARVSTTADLDAALDGSGAGSAVPVLVQRGGLVVYVVIQKPAL